MRTPIASRYKRNCSAQRKLLRFHVPGASHRIITRNPVSMRIDAENRVRWVCKEQLLLLLLLLLYGVVDTGLKVHLHCSFVPTHRTLLEHIIGVRNVRVCWCSRRWHMNAKCLFTHLLLSFSSLFTLSNYVWQ